MGSLLSSVSLPRFQHEGPSLRWLFLAFRFYRARFAELGSGCASPLPRGGRFSQVNPSHGTTDVRRVYAPRFFVSSQQRFGVTDIKAPRRVAALGGLTVL